MNINEYYKECENILIDLVHQVYIERRGAGVIAWCIGCVESFIDKNDLKPKINDTLKGKSSYSIAFDTETNTLKTCVTHSDFVLPFFCV